jgi:hypothetical protein
MYNQIWSPLKQEFVPTLSKHGKLALKMYINSFKTGGSYKTDANGEYVKDAQGNYIPTVEMYEKSEVDKASPAWTYRGSIAEKGAADQDEQRTEEQRTVDNTDPEKKSDNTQETSNTPSLTGVIRAAQAFKQNKGEILEEKEAKKAEPKVTESTKVQQKPENVEETARQGTNVDNEDKEADRPKNAESEVTESNISQNEKLTPEERSNLILYINQLKGTVDLLAEKPNDSAQRGMIVNHLTQLSKLLKEIELKEI